MLLSNKKHGDLYEGSGNYFRSFFLAKNNLDRFLNRCNKIYNFISMPLVTNHRHCGMLNTS